MTDRRATGGLNNQGLPMRKVLRTERVADGEVIREGAGVAGEGLTHVLECGHALPPVGACYVRHRRCTVCGPATGGGR